MLQGSSYFEEMEIWRKRQIRKDPIAVGVTGNGDRYLICRWGMDRLVPFEKIKSRSWLYHIENFGVLLLTSEKFWLSTAAATLLAMTYIGFGTDVKRASVQSRPVCSWDLSISSQLFRLI